MELIDWVLISSWVLNLKKLAGPRSVEKGTSFWLNGANHLFTHQLSLIHLARTQETFLMCLQQALSFFSTPPQKKKYFMYSMCLWWHRCSRHICPFVIACTCIYQKLCPSHPSLFNQWSERQNPAIPRILPFQFNILNFCGPCTISTDYVKLFLPPPLCVTTQQ